MFPNYFEKIIYKKNTKILLIVSYSLIVFLLFFAFIASARKNASDKIKGDMQKRMDNFLLSVDAEFNSRVGYAMSLVTNNSMRMPLNLGIYGQVKEFLESDETYKNGTCKIMVLNKNKKMVFNSTEIPSSTPDVKFGDTTYSCYFYDKKIYKLNYQPIIYKNLEQNEPGETIGAVISAYDFLDFYKQTPKSTEGIDYAYYGFIDGKMSFKFDGKPVALNNPVKKTSLYKLKKGFSNLNVDGNDTFIYSEYLKLANLNKPFILTIAITNSQYFKIESSYILSSLLYCLVVLIFITVILSFVYVMVNKDFANRLEIQMLRVQRHDFSKHLGVIRGMTTLNEYDQLNKYVEALSENVSFTIELSKLGCPALGVLLQDKELYAKENDVDFNVEVKACVSEIHISPVDLCSIIGNLVDNAIEACMDLKPVKRYVFVEIGTEKDACFFKVTNSGGPIREKELGKIFRPGYTTKKKGKARGMGLYIVSRTLKKHHGNVQVESSSGITSFTAFLPLE